MRVEGIELYCVIFQKFTKKQLNPSAIMCDFEDALKDTLSTAFLRAFLLGDSFHVFYNVRKWMCTHQQKNLANDAVSSVRILWASQNPQEFQEKLQAFTFRWNLAYGTVC